MSENEPRIAELEKSKAHIIVAIIEYVPNAIVSKTIIKKTTGNVTVSSLDAGEELLTFGNNYLLFETSFLNEPLNLREAIFRMQAKGYKPVLAHPERYIEAQRQPDLVMALAERGTRA